jgi:hypothetical protein
MSQSSIPSGAAEAISEFLAHVALAPRQAGKSLTVWPLLWREDAPESPVPLFPTLAEAMEAGRVSVEEVGEGGHVPEVRIRNDGDTAVLFLFGEEILGAKQNRVANASFLLPGHSDQLVDVSCVEAGRWSRRGREAFVSSSEVLSPALRRKLARSVHELRASGGSSRLRFSSDQGEVWREIEGRLHHANVPSGSSAYADYRRSRSRDLAELERAFRPVERQVGFVAALGDEVVGLEVIGRSEVFAHHFRGLLRSYAIDAVDAGLLKQMEGAEGRHARGARFEAPEAFLDALARAEVEAGPSLGVGDDLRLGGVVVEGCALAHGGLVHLTAFPAQAGE